MAIERRLSGKPRRAAGDRHVSEWPRECEAEGTATRPQSGQGWEAESPFGSEKWTANRRQWTPAKDIQGFDSAAQALPRHGSLFLSRCPFLRYKVAAAGIEPSFDFAATGQLPCGCVICEQCRAARALQIWPPEWLEVAFADADLQRVVEAWDQLSTSVRSAIALLVKPSRQGD